MLLFIWPKLCEEVWLQSWLQVRILVCYNQAYEYKYKYVCKYGYKHATERATDKAPGMVTALATGMATDMVKVWRQVYFRYKYWYVLHLYLKGLRTLTMHSRVTAYVRTTGVTTSMRGI